MRGLRTQRDNDDKEFCRFFEIVQQAASDKGCVFFLDTAEGRMGEIGDVVCEELSGWLVPNDITVAFTPLWEQWLDVNKDFSDFFVFAKWSNHGGNIQIEFE